MKHTRHVPLSQWVQLLNILDNTPANQPVANHFLNCLSQAYSYPRLLQALLDGAPSCWLELLLPIVKPTATECKALLAKAIQEPAPGKVDLLLANGADAVSVPPHVIAKLLRIYRQGERQADCVAVLRSLIHHGKHVGPKALFLCLFDEPWPEKGVRSRAD